MVVLFKRFTKTCGKSIIQLLEMTSDYIILLHPWCFLGWIGLQCHIWIYTLKIDGNYLEASYLHDVCMLSSDEILLRLDDD